MKNVIGLVCIFLCSLAFADVAVIVNPASAGASEEEVQRIFLGKKDSFSDGSKATPYYLVEGAAEREVFDTQALGKSSSQIKAYWSKLVFTGKGTPPEELASSQSAKEKVAANKDAIAYVDASVVDDSVKVIATY